MAAAGELRIEEGPLPVVPGHEAAGRVDAVSTQSSIEQAIKLISSGQVPAGRLVTRSVALAQAELAFRAAVEGIDGRLQCVVRRADARG